MVAARPVRRATDITAQQLGRTVLGYLALTVVIITLAPFDFRPDAPHGLSGEWTGKDLVLNVVMFVPLGVMHELMHPAELVPFPDRWRRLLGRALVLSGAIELLQVWLPFRYPSLLDLATNGAGALLGGWGYHTLTRRVGEGRVVQRLALEVPLMAIPYLLVPLAWLTGLGAEADASRRALLLPLAAAGALVLVTVHDRFVRTPVAPHRQWLAFGLAAWTLVAMAPASLGGVWWVVATAGTVVGTAVARLASLRWAGRQAGGDARIERATLLGVIPLLGVHLVASALWPMFSNAVALTRWRWGWSLAPVAVPFTTPRVLMQLEQVAAFALLGYVLAEFRGRHARQFRSTIGALLASAAVVAGLLQLGRGWHPDLGASVLLFASCVAAALFGGWVYVLQRAHVQALVRRRERLRATGSGDGAVPPFPHP